MYENLIPLVPEASYANSVTHTYLPSLYVMVAGSRAIRASDAEDHEKGRLIVANGDKALSLLPDLRLVRPFWPYGGSGSQPRTDVIFECFA